MTTFGSFLRRLRKRLHLTQDELARLVGFSEAQINRLENGVRTPDPDVVVTRFVPALGLANDSEDAKQLVALASLAKHVPARTPRTPSVAAEFSKALPTSATALYGRGQAIDDLLALLNKPDTRLVTLLGSPGIGKSRLALAVAQASKGCYDHGATFVPLAAINDPRMMPDAILLALGITSTASDPLVQLKHALHGRHLLLVLDNLEQLLGMADLDTTAAIIDALIEAAPYVKVLITSRARIRLSYEYLFEVPVLSEQAAVELFLTRARMQHPAFRIREDKDDAAIVAQICRRLDYLPLAIELAASRVRVFQLPELLKRMSAPLMVLNTGPLDLPLRQRTLRKAIEWSYGLLTPDEQKLFRWLGVFADGCTMPMIEAIAGNDLVGAVIDVTQSLVDKSMLKVEYADGAVRFRLLEMLREYALELLDTFDEASIITKRSGQWFVDQVHAMQSDPAIGDSVTWFNWFEAELNNIHAIIRWSIQSNYLDYGLKLAADLKRTWRLHGPVNEGFQLTSQLVLHPNARNDLHLFGLVLLTRAYVAEQIGNITLSEQVLKEALDIFERLGDKQATAWALSQMGDHAITRGEYTTARILLGESIALFRQVGERRGLALALLWYGTIERDQGNYQQAFDIYDEVTSIANEIKSQITSFLAAGWTAFVCNQIGDFERAKTMAHEALEICQTMKLVSSVAIMHGTLGTVALFQGDIDAAISHLEAAHEDMERSGNPDLGAGFLINLGYAMHLKGESAKGESMLRQAIQVHWESGRKSYIPDSIIRLAWIAADQCNLVHAARLMGVAAAMNSQMSISFPESEQIFHQPRLQAVRADLSQNDFEMFWQEGQTMDMKTAIDYALGKLRRSDLQLHGN